MERSPQCTFSGPCGGIRPPWLGIALALVAVEGVSSSLASRARNAAGRAPGPPASVEADGFTVCAVDNPPNPESNSSSWRMSHHVSAMKNPSLRGKTCEALAGKKPRAGRETLMTNTSFASHSAAANWSSSAIGGKGGQLSISGQPSITEGYVRPLIFFLFLTLSGIEREDLWEAFFADADPTQYRTFMHCKFKDTCDMSLAVSNPFGITMVDTVPSHYCHDLVSPMVQLLQSAHVESRSARDHFVFVSESTIPLKPFPAMYNQLTSAPVSGFCIYTKDHWVNLDLAGPKSAIILKHSQWVTLNSEHASLVVKGWEKLKYQMFQQPWSVPIWVQDANKWSTITSQGGLPLPMCIDEWAIFVTLFGAILHDGVQAQLDLPSMKPIQLSGHRPHHGTQGVCHTFAFWNVDDERRTMDLVRVVSPGLSCFPRCAGTHPAEFLSVSDKAARALRDSHFLFARKFKGSAMSLDQFRRIIISGQ